MRSCVSAAVTTSLIGVGSKFCVLKMRKGKSLSTMIRSAARSSTRPSWMRTVRLKANPSPAEPPMSCMSSKAQWTAATSVSSAFDSPSTSMRPKTRSPRVLSGLNVILRLQAAHDLAGALDAEGGDVLDDAAVNAEPVMGKRDDDDAAVHHATRRDLAGGRAAARGRVGERARQLRGEGRGVVLDREESDDVLEACIAESTLDLGDGLGRVG